MFIVLIVSWVHGCIGMYFWLQMKAHFKTAAPFLLAAALLIPTLAMLGLYQGGRRVVHDSGTAQWKAENLSPRQVGTAAEQNIIDSIVDYFLIGYVGLIGFVLIARGVRTLHERRGGMINLPYGNGRTVRVPKGLSVLEASLRNNVPHAHLRRSRSVLYLSNSCGRRLQFAAGAVKARSLRARPCGRRWRSGNSPRLPIASEH